MLYWHWIVLGIVLMISEILLTSFFVLWFGVAAILVGLMILAVPEMTTNWQIISWTLMSAILAGVWFKYLRPLSIDRTKAGLSRESIIGETGQVIRPPREDQRGLLRFPAPILGSDEWAILSQDVLAEGDRVQVSDVVGNALLVKKL